MNKSKTFCGFLALLLFLSGILSVSIAEEKDGISELLELWKHYIEEDGGLWGVAPDNFGGMPKDDEIDLETALRSSVQAILDETDFTLSDLEDYRLRINFIDASVGLVSDTVTPDMRVWSFSITVEDRAKYFEKGFTRGFFVTINALTGEVVEVFTRINDQ